MASFDFVECTAKAYRFVWARRQEVLELSALMLAVKIVSFVGFIVFGLDENFLRQGLLLIPVYMLEGWVIARF